MSKEEFKRIVPNRIISINTFFSTSDDSQLALIFAEKDEHEEDSASVVFEINIPARNPTADGRPFAEIQNESYVKDENELLFCMASRFRIEEMDEYPTFTSVRMTLMPEVTEGEDSPTASTTGTVSTSAGPTSVASNGGGETKKFVFPHVSSSKQQQQNGTIGTAKVTGVHRAKLRSWFKQQPSPPGGGPREKLACSIM